jgi:FG-GAP repeat
MLQPNSVSPRAPLAAALLFALTLFALTASAAAQCNPRLDTPGVSALDRLGIASGLSGDWVVVGAFGDSQVGIKAGAAFAYEYTGSGWDGRQKLLASDATAGDLFGASVALDGTTAVVGAASQGAVAYRAGAVYVFERQAGQYVEVQKLMASDASAQDEFGFAVALDGDRLLVGARYGDAPGATDSGAVYVFERSAGVWTETAKLVASDAAPIDYFGQSLDLDGDLAVVGAWGDDDAGTGTGSAYVFREAGGWTEEQKLLAGDAAAIDYFGFDVAVQGNVIAVGATGWDGASGDEGVVYIFRDQGGWTQDQFLPGVHPGGEFGTSIGFGNGWLVASAVKGNGLAPACGDGVYLVDNGSAFAFLGRLLASDGATDDRFGVSIAVDGDRVVFGAEGQDDGGTWAGASYLFDLPFIDSDLDGLPDNCGGVVVFCTCDGGGTCANPSPDGCLNSTGFGADLMVLSGSLSVASDDLVLRADSVPTNSFGVLFMGALENPPVFLGDGLRCVAAPLYRFSAHATGAFGSFDEGPGIAGYAGNNFPAAGAILPGQTWRFQGWYRDPVGPCGSGSNTTSGLAITFEP